MQFFMDIVFNGIGELLGFAEKCILSMRKRKRSGYVTCMLPVLL